MLRSLKSKLLPNAIILLYNMVLTTTSKPTSVFMFYVVLVIVWLCFISDIVLC